MGLDVIGSDGVDAMLCDMVGFDKMRYDGMG